MSVIDQPIYHDDEAAREHLESLRWPNGPVCPHCGTVGEATKLQGKKHRPGVWKCNACRKQFSVTVGTVFEHSKVPLHTWLLAVYLLCSSKKGMSSHQMHRMLGVTYKTAWFMTHRIREAMCDDRMLVLGGEGSVVEIDETYWGNIPGAEVRPGAHHKEKIVSLVEREGAVRSFHVERVNADTLRPMLQKHVDPMTRVMTDEAQRYDQCCMLFASHETVCHERKEYTRGDVTTNTIEGYFGIMKRGLNGVYHHVGSNHLNRYLSEFDFRYNTREYSDSYRTDIALKGISGKRLTYYDC